MRMVETVSRDVQEYLTYFVQHRGVRKGKIAAKEYDVFRFSGKRYDAEGYC